MNVFDVIETTTDDRTYRSIKRLRLYEIEGRCDRCPPHGGCNKKSHRHYGSAFRSWKNYRKTQYKHNENT